MQTIQNLFDFVLMLNAHFGEMIDTLMIIIAYILIILLGNDVCKAAISYANPVNCDIKFPLISQHPQFIRYSVFVVYLNLGCLVSENAPFHSYSTSIICSIILVGISIIVVSYFCFVFKQKNYINSKPYIPKYFSIKIVSPILISLFSMCIGHIIMPTCEQIAHKLGDIRISSGAEHSKNQTHDNIYNTQQLNSHTNSHYTTTNNTQINSYQTANYQKENDFMVAVLNNPTFNLYEFITVAGLHERNTQFLTESQYQATNYIKNKCSEMNITNFHIVYVKVHKAWNIFKEVQDTDVSFDGMGKYFYEYDMWDVTKPTSCPYPELKHKLSIVPLRLQ